MKQYISELKWEADPFSTNLNIWWAKSNYNFCFYIVQPHFNSYVVSWDAKLWTLDRWEKKSEPFWDSGVMYATPDGAKAACQGHYEQSILDVLTDDAKVKLNIY